jgi:alanyl-tRNA synthetase
MQFDRASDGTLSPLPKPSIDTGMGLERVAAVMQGVLSNYQTDLFTPLIARAMKLTGFSGMTVAEASVSDVKDAASLRIIADHARAATFLISDGVCAAQDSAARDSPWAAAWARKTLHARDGICGARRDAGGLSRVEGNGGAGE